MNGNQYDLFLSYASRPDYRLARDLEQFLETFHEIKTPSGVHLRPLEICRDGSDFQLPSQRERRAGKAPRQSVEAIIEPHLQVSRRLLVLCCPESAESAWVDTELDLFLKHHSEDEVMLAVTAGDPKNHPETVFPSKVIEEHLQRGKYYDFRGARRGSKAADRLKFEDERVTLAAHLHGETAGKIYPVWQRHRLRQRRRRVMMVATGVGLLVLALVATFILKTIADRNYANQLIAESKDLRQHDPTRALLKAFIANSIVNSRGAQNARDMAYATMRKQLRYSSQASRLASLPYDWGSGSANKRQRAAFEFDCTTRDRTFSLKSRQRRVVLIDNEVRGANGERELMPESRSGVEYAVPAFTADEQGVLVGDNLHVYRFYRQVTLSEVKARAEAELPPLSITSESKDSIQVLAGWLAGRYVLVGSEDGWVYAVGEGRRSVTKLVGGSREDLPVQIQIAPSLSAALVRFHSGHTVLVAAGRAGQPTASAVCDEATHFVFAPRNTADRFLTCEDAGAQLWRVEGDRAVLTRTFRHGQHGTCAAAISEDGDYVLIVTDAFTALFWDVDQERPLEQLELQAP